ncbi:dephospho-CoA kinase [Myxosarcina sp. GI1]|uniref:dephospho-CoA kinase n=1 Tax=Myxosarcina sp. GI1 TaxID=1541065 RepID=UPI000A935597|nr:dephospho-CoA kinase [Myxosarcina sp. GI1]
MIKNLSRRIIGVTGGIATGKTTVTNYLATKYNFPVLDADLYAREAVAIGSPILTAIFIRYGDRLKLADGSLNRSALGEIIFNNSDEKRWLESQIHPFVRDRFNSESQNLHDKTLVYAIPLLFEANLTNLVTEIWVVYCDRAIQIERLQQRDGLSREQALARIDARFPLADKIERANIVLCNNTNRDFLLHQVDKAVKSSD